MPLLEVEESLQKLTTKALDIQNKKQTTKL